MTSLTRASLAFCLIGPVMGQGFTTPAGYLTTEGGTYQNVGTTNGYAYYFGRYASARVQQIDGEIKAKGLQTLTSVGFRPDYRSHSSSTATGRSWTNVTLDLSDGDFASASSTFSANQLTTPTRVFSGSVTWPTLTGNPSSQPAAWSNDYRFPFGTGGSAGQFVYLGQKDLTLDFVFTGGALANASTWTGSTGFSYYLDGLYVLTATTYGRYVYKSTGTTTGDCTDSAQSSGYASGSIQVGLYGPAYTGNSAWTNKAVMQIFGSNTAPNSFVLHAIGVNGNTPGVSIPAFGCYNLMIDLTQLVNIYKINTNSSGSRSWLYVPIADLNVLAPLGTSVSIWSQAAWTDSSTGQTKLTTAERCNPDFGRKFNTSSPQKKTVYNYSASSATGSGPYDYFYMNPITKYN